MERKKLAYDVMSGNHISVGKQCPGCLESGMEIFYDMEGAPVHSVLLMETRESARSYPKGRITLGFCHECGSISNTSFNPAMNEYSQNCEETQGFSGTYNGFARELAADLVQRYSIRGKEIIEIGCGKGEFLTLLCEIGENRGVGFDPAYVSSRNRSAAAERIQFIKDLYSDKYSDYTGDFIVCKMTLEHIANTGEFLRGLRESIGDSDTMLFFQVPDVARILSELAFWDIYYEHCSYFSAGSLKNLFKACGFEILDIRTGYDGQYLLLEARPSEKTLQVNKDPFDDLSGGVQYFSEYYPQKIAIWRYKLQELYRTGYRIVIWGSGSKGVSFLTTLGIEEEIRYAVDVNPYRHGTFMPGTGQEIVSPQFLKEYRPDIVIVMNPIYKEEISESLSRLGLEPRVITV